MVATSGGRPLYFLTSDPRGGSRCTGLCTREWRPLIVRGDPDATEGLDGSLLGTFTRSDGGTQVLYNGHALYTYERPGAGLASGAGVKWAGGTWYLVDRSGKAITTTAVGGY